MSIFSARPPKPPPRRGAPSGNLNALKHGFYSHLFRKIEMGDLQAIPLDGLQDEIGMLRVLIRRVMELAQDIQNLDEALRLLSTLSLATANLSRLVKTQRMFSSNFSEFNATVDEVISELTENWRRAKEANEMESQEEPLLGN